METNMETTGTYWGLGFRVGLGIYWVYMRIMEDKMEATILCSIWGTHIGLTETKMETTI